MFNGASSFIPPMISVGFVIWHEKKNPPFNLAAFKNHLTLRIKLLSKEERIMISTFNISSAFLFFSCYDFLPA
jgi:hypothetical protein